MPKSVIRTRLAPCWPGGRASFSMGHLAVSQRVPFRKSFTPTRRQTRHFAPISLATLDSPLFPRPASVVRQRGHVFDGAHVEARRLERADGAFTARAGALDLHLELADAELGGLLGARLGGLLGGERRRLARPLVPDRARRGPAEGLAARVGDRDDRVVEAGLDVADRAGHELLRLAGALLDGLLGALAGLRRVARLRGVRRLGGRGRSGGLLLFCHVCSCLALDLGDLLARDRLAGTLPRARVRARPLSAHRQVAAMPRPAVARDLLQALDVLLEEAAQRALDRVALVDDRVDPAELVLAEVLDLQVLGDVRVLEDPPRERVAHAVDVGQA